MSEFNENKIISLIVKAEPLPAIEEVNNRGMAHIRTKSNWHSGVPETIIHVPYSRSNLDKIAEWYAQSTPLEPPFPLGTLLHYSIKEE